MQIEVSGDSPKKDLELSMYCINASFSDGTLPSSDPEASKESLKGFLQGVSRNYFSLFRGSQLPTSLCPVRRQCVLEIAVFFLADDPFGLSE